MAGEFISVVISNTKAVPSRSITCLWARNFVPSMEIL